MAISSSSRKAGPYLGNDLTTSFPFEFKVFSTDDVVVVKTDPAGAETTLSLGTDYSVTLNSDQNTDPGGNVVVPSALATGYMLTLTSGVDALQPVDITNLGGFYPKVMNDALDRLTILVQQAFEQISRSVKVNISSDAQPDDLLNTLLTSASNALTAAAQAVAAAEAAQESAATIDVSTFPKKDGTGATGTWEIDISGNSATAAHATSADIATTATHAATAGTANAIEDGAVSTSAKIADSIITPAKMSQQPGESSGALSGLTEFAKTDIPSWATQIDIVFSGVSLAVTDRLRVQLGAASYSTSGYAAVAGANSGDAALTTGFPMMSGNIPIADAYYGTMTIKKLTAAGNTWSMVSLGHSGTVVQNGAGEIALAAPLERVRFNTVGGSTFDSGNVTFKYR